MGRLRNFMFGLFMSFVPLPGAVAQDTGASFYAGRTIRILVGYAPGGSADGDPRVLPRSAGPLVAGAGNAFEIYAQLLARHLGRHIAGAPSVIVQNMPGAGGLTLMTYMARGAAPDGLTLALFNPTNSIEPLLNPVLATFDARTFGWLGSMNREAGTCAFWADKVQNLDDLKHQEVVLGGTGPMASSTRDALVLKALLGLNFRLILGYPSLLDIRHPAERGEVDGFCGLLVSSLNPSAREDLRNGKFRIVLQTGLEAHPSLPASIPDVFDLAVDDEARQILRLVFAPWSFGKPVAAPPGTPPERLAVLRTAFAATLADPAFLGDAAAAGIEISAMGPDDLSGVLATLYATPRALIERTMVILGNHER
ncbi:MAG: tripartite tricarboxylate transporter family receptor [Hyphomicrobiales bacterium]|nr:tripartite tricarboxylate transporter family receptor [Hyphomicrobiales bacterium]